MLSKFLLHKMTRELHTEVVVRDRKILLKMKEHVHRQMYMHRCEGKFLNAFGILILA